MTICKRDWTRRKEAFKNIWNEWKQDIWSAGYESLYTKCATCCEESRLLKYCTWIYPLSCPLSPHWRYHQHSSSPLFFLQLSLKKKHTLHISFLYKSFGKRYTNVKVLESVKVCSFLISFTGYYSTFQIQIQQNRHFIKLS